MNIADRIQSLRKNKAISQEELANKVGVSRQAVSKWESDQSAPDLDRVIIMSEYFGVTTDYILRGIEPQKQSENGNINISQMLYIASTAFLAIGLFAAFDSWYTEQSSESIWGSMIIQVVGVTAYFIGRLISQSKTPFTIKWLNITIGLFMPISLIVAFIFRRVISPYPTDIVSGSTFALVYIVTIILSFFTLKKLENNIGK
jgi:transcriptional regulator with XRE-family HTH domain